MSLQLPLSSVPRSCPPVYFNFSRINLFFSLMFKDKTPFMRVLIRKMEKGPNPRLHGSLGIAKPLFTKEEPWGSNNVLIHQTLVFVYFIFFLKYSILFSWPLYICQYFYSLLPYSYFSLPLFNSVTRSKLLYSSSNSTIVLHLQFLSSHSAP